MIVFSSMIGTSSSVKSAPSVLPYTNTPNMNASAVAAANCTRRFEAAACSPGVTWLPTCSGGDPFAPRFFLRPPMSAIIAPQLPPPQLHVPRHAGLSRFQGIIVIVPFEFPPGKRRVGGAVSQEAGAGNGPSGQMQVWQGASGLLEARRQARQLHRLRGGLCSAQVSLCHCTEKTQSPEPRFAGKTKCRPLVTCVVGSAEFSLRRLIAASSPVTAHAARR